MAHLIRFIIYYLSENYEEKNTTQVSQAYLDTCLIETVISFLVCLALFSSEKIVSTSFQAFFEILNCNKWESRIMLLSRNILGQKQ